MDSQVNGVSHTWVPWRYIVAVIDNALINVVYLRKYPKAFDLKVEK